MTCFPSGTANESYHLRLHVLVHFVLGGGRSEDYEVPVKDTEDWLVG